MTLDEAIDIFKEIANNARNDIIDNDNLEPQEIHYNAQLELYAKEKEQIAEWLEELKQYKAIGTPEECLAAVEKQKIVKPIIEYKQTQDCVTEVEWKCPICGTNYIELEPCGEWCSYCGQKLDWSDKE